MSSLIVKAQSGSDIEPVPEGLHPAVCVGIFDVGTIYEEKWGKASHKGIIKWELPKQPLIKVQDKLMPRCLTKVFTLSLHEKANLRQTLESWRGKRFTEVELGGFDLEKVLGKPCQIQVIHNTKGDKTYATIMNVLPATDGDKQIVAATPADSFSISDLTELAFPEDLPEWICAYAMKSREWEKLEIKAKGISRKDIPATAQPTEEPLPPEDDVPF